MQQGRRVHRKGVQGLCVNAGINVEYTATNTPQQNGVSERDGQTLAQITRCLMKDGNFPPSLWGELIFTAAYLSNRPLHSALGGATPYFRMHNKEADLSRLRAIGARAFVYRETYTRESWTAGRSKESYADASSSAGNDLPTNRSKQGQRFLQCDRPAYLIE